MVALTTTFGAACYMVWLPFGRMFAAAFALVGAAAVVVIAG